MIDLRGLYIEEMEEFFKERGIPRFRAAQIFGWLNKNLAESFDDMKNIPKKLKEQLSADFYISEGKIIRKLVSSADNTCKYLFEFENNTIIEGVLMKYGYGYAACISTQAGCNMGCKFCASAIGGKDRNMTAGELLNEVYLMERDCGERIGHVVLMGSGEPLDNFDEVIRFIRLINSEKGYNRSQRRITLSTCGITDKIYELMEERLQITLAVSLHAPNDDIRKRTMPVAKKYPMKELVDACGAYAEETGRRVTFEYALIKGINDSPQCAGELGERLKNILCHVNLIPVNDVKGKDEVFTRSSDRDIKDFCAILRSKGIETTIRRELGSDINAACGQLRKGYIEDNA